MRRLFEGSYYFLSFFIKCSINSGADTKWGVASNQANTVIRKIHCPKEYVLDLEGMGEFKAILAAAWFVYRQEDYMLNVYVVLSEGYKPCK